MSVVDLDRFLDAQVGSYAGALNQLNAGHKTSHWMWFVFPQIEGLGSSSMARRYAITSREEAEAYLRHPVLGSRLTVCCQALLNCGRSSITAILGSPDDMKLKSSMTLFKVVAGEPSIFGEVLQKLYGGAECSFTRQRLG